MRFPHARRRYQVRKKKRIFLPFLLPVLIISIIAFLIYVNSRLTPIFIGYAEVQTTKIAALVMNKAINSRVSNVLDVNDIIMEIPSESSENFTAVFNTDIINRVRAETTTLVQAHLEQAESGNLELLPTEDDAFEFDQEAMEDKGGIVFYVPLGQATNIPLLGNLGPKIPIRFHLIGNVESDVETSITEFGINNAMVEVNIRLTVNVQIIVPLATATSKVEQTVPVAIGLYKGRVPHIYTQGEGGSAPSIEVPIPLPDDNGN